MGKTEGFSNGIIKWEFKGSEVLRFKDLKVGDWFIFMPSPGDDSGHGGFKGAHHIFIKTMPFPNEFLPEFEQNAIMLASGNFSSMPPNMPVICVK